MQIQFQSTALVVVFLITMALFTLQQRLSRLAESFARLDQTAITNEHHVEALFSAYTRLLLSIGEVSAHLQVNNWHLHAVHISTLMYRCIVPSTNTRRRLWSSSIISNGAMRLRH